MNIPRISRKLHTWAAVVTALPFLLVIATGVLLQLEPQLPWVKPPSAQGSGDVPTLSFDALLESAKSAPGTGIESWKDVDRLDVQMDKGITKVISTGHWEVQVDHQTGKVLSSAARRAELIESLHDGSFFSEGVKFGIFLPCAVLLLLLWITGCFLFLQPSLRKLKLKRRAAGS